MFGTESSMPILVSLVIQILLVPLQTVNYFARRRDSTRLRFLILLVSYVAVNSIFLLNETFQFMSIKGDGFLIPFVVISFPIFYVRRYISKELGISIGIKSSIGLFMSLAFVVWLNDFTTVLFPTEYGGYLWLFIIPFETVLVLFNVRFFREIISLKNTGSPIYIASIISLFCLLILPFLILSFDSLWLESVAFNLVFFVLSYAYFVQYYSTAKSETEFLTASNKLNAENLNELHLTAKINGNSIILTPREEEIAIQLINGLSYKEIAENCFMTESGVRKHASNIFSKVEVSNLIEFREKCSPK